jgi:manganese transport protein
MAIGLKLLTGLPMLFGVTLSLFDTFLVMFLVRHGMRMLEAFIIALVGIIGVSFLIELFLSKPQVSEIIGGMVPTFPGAGALFIAIGIIGATLMPHNIYLHSSIVQTRKYSTDKKGLRKAIRYNFFDTAIALNLALFVNAAILVLAASAFFRTGHTEIEDIADAHRMLEPVLGTYLAPVLFAIALIASGQSSTLTGTVSGQVVMEGYLNLRIEPWLRRLITRLLAVIPAFITIAVAGEDKSGSLLILSQVILSLQLGFAVIPLAHWTSSKKIMGNFRINVPARIVSWIAVGTIVTLNVKLVIETLIGLVASARNPLVLYFLVIPLVAATFLLLLYTILEPVVKFRIPLKLVPAHHQPEELKLDKPPAFRRIAIDLDFTESDNRTVSYAVTQGGRQAEYFLIHVVESAGARMIRSDISDRETADDKSFLDNYTSQLTARDYR